MYLIRAGVLVALFYSVNPLDVRVGLVLAENKTEKTTTLSSVRMVHIVRHVSQYLRCLFYIL